MPDELTTFHTKGPSWAERATTGELNAVLSPLGPERLNLFLHEAHLFAAQQAMALCPPPGTVLDFGSGNGRFLRFFGGHGYQVIGTEITAPMQEEARRLGLPPHAAMMLTDGITIPLRDGTVDMVWCCGVLRYSLLVAQPVYHRIAAEMYRVLKAGGLVVNTEVYVDNPPATFTRDFEAAGFQTQQVNILQRYAGRLEGFIQAPWVPLSWVRAGARACTRFRFRYEEPSPQSSGLRDYFFVWRKP